MVYVTICRNQDRIAAFNCIGHAGYGQCGQDIVCAAISMLVINTINSIENFTDDKMRVVDDEESGLISVEFLDTCSKESDLLVRSMILGLQGIQQTYGMQYLRLDFKEV